MPESMPVISASCQLQLLHAARSTLETAGIYLASLGNFFGGRRMREGAEREQRFANLFFAKPWAFSIRT